MLEMTHRKTRIKRARIMGLGEKTRKKEKRRESRNDRPQRRGERRQERTRRKEKRRKHRHSHGYRNRPQRRWERRQGRTRRKEKRPSTTRMEGATEDERPTDRAERLMNSEDETKEMKEKDATN
jgi:hypothetical protein